MKCKNCKEELNIKEDNFSIINGTSVIQCEKCLYDNFDVNITNKTTLNKLYWNYYK